MLSFQGYKISSKFYHGKILFQCPVWCGDNFGGGACRDRQTCNFDNQHCCPFVCMNIVCARTYIVVDPLPCGKILRVTFIGMIARKCGDILRKYGNLWDHASFSCRRTIKLRLTYNVLLILIFLFLFCLCQEFLDAVALLSPFDSRISSRLSQKNTRKKAYVSCGYGLMFLMLARFIALL